MSEIAKKKVRNSNLELYRIIVMLLIVAHHYVVNSGLIQAIAEAPFTAASYAMVLFGGWGKIGINCFVLITGYFMCTSKITGTKLLKLYLQILFYGILIYGIFCITGHETFSPLTAALKFFPVKSLASNFVGCFLVFYLLIPFLNILIRNIDKRQHGWLVLLLVSVFSVLPSFPAFNLSFNYVGWFAVLYFIASYVRFYGADLNITHRQWGWLTLISLLACCLSMVTVLYLKETGRVGTFLPYFFVTDSNKLLALIFSLASFMWFKDLKIKYYPFINAVGATTFGVLLIHANSDAMRQWLWRETVDCIGHFSPTVVETLLYAIVSVLLIFSICSFFDWLRIKLVEETLLKTVKQIIRPLPFPFRSKNEAL